MEWPANGVKLLASCTLGFVRRPLKASANAQACCITNENTGQKPYKCDLCAAGFSYGTMVSYHKRKHAEFGASTKLWVHKRTHMGERPYKYDLCLKQFSQNKSPVCRKRIHMGSTSSDAQFKICTAPFEPQFKNTAQITMNSLPTEQPSDQTETQQGDKLYKCDVCPVTCIDVGHLEVDPKTQKTKTFTCNTCSAMVCRASTLRVHAHHHSGEGSSYKCSLYPAQVSRSIYPRRNKRAHMGKKRYKCDLCPAEFSHHTSLWNHKQTHTGTRYKCELCPAEFSRSANLSCHKRKHMGEKPYKCDLCPAAFTQGAVLLYHKRLHTGEKPFKCDVCPAEFVRSTNLSCHRRKHTGEKRYKCDFCPKEFGNSTTLSRHRREALQVRSLSFRAYP
ncbi:zinc finger protein ZFP2-like [Ornithodoros turicata]|uniref:zinc finger protein ZFP2-like n=1 Tax=Ornithodoros turicata TaxID=34597 RepID=UPI003139518D